MKSNSARPIGPARAGSLQNRLRNAKITCEIEITDISMHNSSIGQDGFWNFLNERANVEVFGLQIHDQRHGLPL